MIHSFPGTLLCILALQGALFVGSTPAAPYQGPGIQSMKLVSDINAIVPGETFTIGLLIVPEPEHHTYWKGPGIVGVATSIEWDLPEGFEAGPILWPAPEKVDMVGIAANGYREATILLTEIEVPETLPNGMYSFHAKVAWMACSTSCNPGLTEFTFMRPCNPGEFPNPENPSIKLLLDSFRKEIPPPAPGSWKKKVKLTDKNTITLTLSIPEMNQELAGSIEFFCDDMQVNSDEPTKLTWIDNPTGTFELQFSRPDFAPKAPSQFSGVIRNSAGWPSADSHFFEISVPWPEGTFPDE